ncbi:RNA polymerase sigma factor [Povalibacter sp.]|uniref:RNA polymerase sigma factor n=1 Tax=Povalibacter sp. TaxID=1962978 RepID=UPI002F420A20
MDLKDATIDRMSDLGDASALAAPLGRVAAFAAAPPVQDADDDAALMLRYRDGDMRAFELLYSKHKGGLYRYLQRLCHNPDVANDLFQEVWSKVIATRERYEPRAQFNTFLFRIAHNCAVDYFRRAGRQQTGRMEDVGELEESLPDTPVSQPDTQVSEMQVRASFRQALEDLPAEQREVFLLYEETGLSLEDIGRTTGVAMETAKSRLRYAFRKLRTALRHHQPRIEDRPAGQDIEP